MEFKLKDGKNNPHGHEWNDMADYRDDMGKEEINMLRESIEIEPEEIDRKKHKNRSKKKGVGYAIIFIIGAISLVIAIGAFVLSIVSSLMKTESEHIIKNSYVAIGTINQADEIYISVTQLSHSSDSLYKSYSINWEQQLYVEVRGQNGNYVTTITVGLKNTSTEYRADKFYSHSMIEEDFKDVEVTSPYKKGQEYEFYVSGENQNKIYFKDKVDENLDVSPFKRIANRIGILALILGVVCLSISGLPERN